jgi:hypothetical protein
MFPVEHFHHGFLVNFHHGAIDQCGCRAHPQGLPGETTLSEETALVQNANCGFLPDFRHNSEFYLSLLQMDENNFYRAVIRNGEKTAEIKVPDNGDKKSFRTILIRVSPTELVHQIKQGDNWTVLDRWTQPGANLSLGKFGFYIPGNDQVALSSFSHYGDLNIR